jgi:hypothetical protein
MKTSRHGSQYDHNPDHYRFRRQSGIRKLYETEPDGNAGDRFVVGASIAIFLSALIYAAIAYLFY